MSEREYKPPPAFLFYPADFTVGTAAMTPKEKGAYMSLLCYQWSHGSIPPDPEKQRRIAGCKVTKEVLNKFSPNQLGDLQNERMEHERQKQEAWREKQRAKGVKSGVARRTTVEPRLNHGSTTLGTEREPEGNLSLFSSHSSVQSMRESTHAHEAERPGIEEVLARAQTIGLAEWKARDWFSEMEGAGWLDHQHRPVVRWQSIMDRVRTKWEADGRPAGPPAAKVQVGNGSHERPLSIMDLKTIIQAKEDTAAKIKREFASDTAIDTVWSSNAKRAEWLKLRAEIKKLKERLSGMA